MPTADTTRVLLLTDLADSTRWGQRLGAAAAAALWAQHDRLARDLLQQWRGREIDKSDGFLLLFDSVSDALGYAAIYHAMLAALEPPLRARAGVHQGPVGLRENPPHDVARGAKPLEVDGAAKPIAARIMALARPGQTLLSAAARASAGPDSGGALAAHGHWQLKGIDEPVELYEALPPHGLPEAPADGDKGWRVVLHDGQWLPASERPHSLPAERDRFIGRRTALRDIAARFERGARLVSLLGPGGTGKTRLAVRCGWVARGEHAGGVWFCDLANARDLDGIVHAMAQGLQLTLRGADPVADIGEAIAGRGRCLVIADNFEQVARHAEATLGRWLERAPQARFIVTTREVLGIAGEDVLALPPLPTDEGAALFVERAAAAGSGPLAAHDQRAVPQLVELLDGLPLAIELAASRVRVLAPAQLLPRMAERFKLLTSSHGRRDRQATLRATLDWSWDLLGEVERSVLAQLSVFEGGFALDAAERVVELSACTEAPWVVDVVQSLAQKSLVRPAAHARFELLRSVHDYAAQQLVADGAVRGGGPALREQAFARHLQHFSALDEGAATRHRCADGDNLIAACRRALASHDARAAARVLLPAWAALRLVGPFRTGVELADAICALPGADRPATTAAQWVRGSARYLLGQAAAARADLEAARSLVADDALRGRIACSIAEVELATGDAERSAALFHEALQIARARHETARQCQALNGLGTLAAEHARLAEAAAWYEQGLAVARASADRRWEGGLLGNIGTVLHAQGRLHEARQRYEQALACAREIGDRHFEGNTRCNLGLLALEMDELDDALPHFEAALELARALGHQLLVGTVLCNMGLLNEGQGRPEAALELHQQAVEVATRIGDRRTGVLFRAYLGRLLARSGRIADARHCLATGAALLADAPDPLNASVLLCAQAETEHLAGDRAAARALLQQARAEYDRSETEPASSLGRELARLEALVLEAARQPG